MKEPNPMVDISRDTDVINSAGSVTLNACMATENVSNSPSIENYHPCCLEKLNERFAIRIQGSVLIVSWYQGCYELRRVEIDMYIPRFAGNKKIFQSTSPCVHIPKYGSIFCVGNPG